MDKHNFMLRFRDRNDNIKDMVVSIPEDDYRSEMSYRENLQYIASEMYNDGGLWIDENVIIPYHRVLSIECYNGQDQKNNNNNRDRRFFRHRHNKSNNDQPVVRDESQNKIPSNGNVPTQPQQPQNPV